MNHCAEAEIPSEMRLVADKDGELPTALFKLYINQRTLIGARCGSRCALGKSRIKRVKSKERGL